MGPLYRATIRTARRATAGGHRLRVPTAPPITVDDDGVAFTVRVRTGKRPRPPGPDPENPFLPYQPELFVADVAPSHAAILNKYWVVDNHLLVVTKHYEPQEGALTRADFDALMTALQGFDGLGFYNAGPVAGASQHHRHLQIIPLPLGHPPVPIARRFGSLPFRHHLVRLDPTDPAQAASQAFETYEELTERSPRPPPYNLLVTQGWLLWVPRSKAAHAGIECNAMGYAGAILVKGEDKLARLRDIGPMRLLVELGYPA